MSLIIIKLPVVQLWKRVLMFHKLWVWKRSLGLWKNSCFTHFSSVKMSWEFSFGTLYVNEIKWRNLHFLRKLKVNLCINTKLFLKLRLLFFTFDKFSNCSQLVSSIFKIFWSALNCLLHSKWEIKTAKKLS